MEDTNDEKPKTMEERVENNLWDEWTIINDEKDKLTVSPRSDDNSEKDEDNDQGEASVTVEQAREVIEEIDPSLLENSVVSPASHDEESDGISVISESDKGDSDTNGSLSKIIEPIGKYIPRTGGYTDCVAVCCLAAAIAFGIGWIVGIGCVVGNGNISFSTSDIEVVNEESLNPDDDFRADVFGDAFVTIESESFPLSDSAMDIIAQEFEEVGITGESNKHLPKENMISKNLNIPNFEKISPFKDSFQKVQLSLKTLCSLIENNQKVENKNHICRKTLAIADVIELKDTVAYMVNELGYREEASAKKLIQNVESKMENLAQTFLDELMKMIGNHMARIDQKLLKIGDKIYQRICLIRNTYANNARIQDILDKRHISLKNCENRKSPHSDNPKREEKEKVNKEEQDNHSVTPDEIIELDLSEVVENSQRSQNNKNQRKNVKSKNFKATKTFKSFQEESYENSNEAIDINSSEYMKNHDKNNFKSKKNYKSYKNSNENTDRAINSNFYEGKEKRIHYKGEKYGSFKEASKENYVEQNRGNLHKDFNDNDKQQNENVCYSKKCSKPYDKEKKENRKGNGKNGDWQFERAQGRNRYRSYEEDTHGVWYDNRARARERARLNY